MAQQFYSPLQLNSTLTVGVDDTGHDVKFFGATSGRYLLWDESQDRLEFQDNVKAVFGTGADLTIYHDGSNSIINQQDGKTGNLIIQQGIDDADIILKSDDGSGGTTAYLTLDGSATRTVFNESAQLVDSKYLYFGTGADAHIRHDGSNYAITNSEGTITIDNVASDKDIIFKGNDGGSTITALTLDMSDAGTASFNHDIKLSDSGKLRLGSSNDLEVYHNGTASYITNDTGHLNIENNHDDGDILFKCDNGSGGLTAYLTLDGGLGYSRVHKTLRFDDSTSLALGVNNDFLAQHDGTDTLLYNDTGDLYIANRADDKDIIFQNDDGSGGLQTYMWMDGSSANGTNTYTRMDDNSMMGWGTGFDMYMYHNGTNSYLTNATGNLYIDNGADDSNIYLRSDDGSGGIATYMYLDGVNTMLKIDQNTRVADSKYFAVGSGSDLQLSHDGSHSYMIQNGVGNLYIRQSVADADLILSCDDGSGGDAAYITLDGSAGVLRMAKDMYIPEYIYHQSDDNTKFGFSGADTFKIFTGGAEVLRVNGGSTTDEAAVSILCGGGTNAENIALLLKGDTNGEALKIKIQNPNNSGTLTGAGILSYEPDADTFNIGQSTTHNNMAISIDNSENVTINKRKFTKTGNTDGTADGDVVYFGGTTSMTTGALYHYKSDGTWELADADAASTCDGLLGVALGAASNTNGVLLRGMVTLDHDPGAVGDVLYVSTTAGDTTATAPSGSGDIVRVIGYCIDASNGQIWFNPDGTFVEVA